LILAALVLSFANSATADDDPAPSRSDSRASSPMAAEETSERGVFLSNEEVRRRGGVGNYLFRRYPGPYKELESERMTASNEELRKHQDDELVADVDPGFYEGIEDEGDQQAGIAGTSSELQSSLMDANSKLYFDRNSSSLDDGRDDLAAIGDLLAENRSLKIEVDGFADSSGTDDYNLALSRKRAEAVTEELLANGATRDQIIVKAWGESRQVPGENNRKVELNLAET
jgi:outer membrane protein OmpA-like peptidoglycan-associated protein